MRTIRVVDGQIAGLVLYVPFNCFRDVPLNDTATFIRKLRVEEVSNGESLCTRFCRRPSQGNLDAVFASYLSAVRLELGHCPYRKFPRCRIFVYSRSSVILNRVVYPDHTSVSYTHLRAHETDSYLVC